MAAEQQSVKDYGVEGLEHGLFGDREKGFIDTISCPEVDSPVESDVFRYVFVKVGREGEQLTSEIINTHNPDAEFSLCVVQPYDNLFMVTQGSIWFSICKDTPEFGTPIQVKSGEYLLVPANTRWRFSRNRGSVLILLPIVLPEDPLYDKCVVFQ